MVLNLTVMNLLDLYIKYFYKKMLLATETDI